MTGEMWGYVFKKDKLDRFKKILNQGRPIDARTLYRMRKKFSASNRDESKIALRWINSESVGEEEKIQAEHASIWNLVQATAQKFFEKARTEMFEEEDPQAIQQSAQRLTGSKRKQSTQG